MNKNAKRIKKLILLFVILLATLIMLQNLPNFFQKEPPAAASFKPDYIKTITIVDKGKKTVLKNNGGKWIVLGNKEKPNFEAEKRQVDQLISIITKLKKSEVVSINEKNYSIFAVDGQKSITLESKAPLKAIGLKPKTVTIFVGRSSLPNQGYFRVKGDPKVYSAPADLDNLFSQQDFRDLSLHLITDKSRLGFITIRWDKEPFTLRKVKNSWKLVDAVTPNQKLATERIDYFINDLYTLKGNDAVEKRTVETSSLPIEGEIVIGEDEKKTTVVFYRVTNSNLYYVAVSNSLILYQINQSKMAMLKKTKDDFIEK